jgi:hypothetical protein
LGSHCSGSAREIGNPIFSSLTTIADNHREICHALYPVDWAEQTNPLKNTDLELQTHNFK